MSTGTNDYTSKQTYIMGTTASTAPKLCRKDSNGNVNVVESGGNTIVSPATLTTNVNNWNPGSGTMIRVQSSGTLTITGMVAGTPGQKVYIWNIGLNQINFTYQDAASSAGNRWLTSGGATASLTAYRCAIAMYDNISAVWRLVIMP